MQFVRREQRCCILIPMPLFHEVNKPQFILSTCLGSLFDGCCWWGGLSTRAEGLKREAQPSWLWCGADFSSWAPSPSLPVLSQGGFVLLGPLSGDWPWHGSTSLLLCGPNVPPLTTLSRPHLGVFTGDNFTAVAVPGRSFWLLHLLFSPPSWSCLLWCSSQASSESWAGWKWGIRPFFPLLALFPYVSFGT